MMFLNKADGVYRAFIHESPERLHLSTSQGFSLGLTFAQKCSPLRYLLAVG